MPTFRRFEDIEAWQKARDLVRLVCAVSGRGRFAKDFVLRGQIRRAAVSVPSNIAEGFGRGGSGKFAQFLAVANGSICEVRSQLYLALGQGYLSQEDFAQLTEAATAVGSMVGGLMAYLRGSDIKGVRHKKPTTAGAGAGAGRDACPPGPLASGQPRRTP
jgi:four helix bundle protein